MTIFSLMSVGWGLECEEGEVDLGWGNCNDYINSIDNSDGCMSSGCFSIEETTRLSFYYPWGISGEEIPSVIGELVNLTHLGLDDNSLSGPIPPEIWNLTQLEFLGLSLNYLSGEISSEIGNLTNLTKLYLDSNQLTGEIPFEIGNLTNLTRLRLSYNQLTGEIPENICDLSLNWGDFYSFNIGNNQLCPPYPECLSEEDIGYQDTSNCEEPPLCDEETEVELWGECYNIEETTDLYLQNSGLTGEIPSEIGNLINLERIWLHDNQLTGSIPPEIGTLINLQELILRNNQLTGGIPQELGNLQEILYFDLSFNPLGGSIPSEIWNLESLWDLWLVENELVGEIPNEVGNLLNLNSLGLSQNEFYGELPIGLWNLDLNTLGLSDNQFTGEISPEISNMNELEYFSIGNNQFSSLPNSICSFDETVLNGFDGDDYDESIWYYFSMGNNNFCNDLPDCTENINGFNYTINIYYNFENEGLLISSNYQPQDCEEPSLCDEETEVELWGECYNIEETTYISMIGDDLSSEIPQQIGDLVNLETLDLGHNNLFGNIPSEIGNLTNLRWLMISNNELTGELPSEIGNLNNLRELILTGNQLIGDIPIEIGNLDSLTQINLNSNQLSGEIPSEVGNLMNLERLLLVGNQLSGEIPHSVGNLTNLESLFLSHNQLSGEIPSEIGLLNNLELLWLDNNQFSSISDNICNQDENLLNGSFEVDDGVYYNFSCGNNFICENIPYCLETSVGFNSGIGIESESFEYQPQDCSEQLLCDEETEVELWAECYNIEETTHLYLYGNQLSGEIPPEIGNLTNLTRLYLYDNQLTGLIFENICNLMEDGLNVLLNSNQFCPPYPSCFSQSDIGYQDTSECEELPSCDEETEVELWGWCYNIEETTSLNLSNSGFTGEIPSEICNLTNLTELELGGNQLPGEIPSCIGNLTNLTSLSLSSNQLTGSIPSEIGNLTNLTYLDLRYNELTGEIPSEIWEMTNLTYLDLRYNELTGEIPPEIGDLENLTSLSLSSNQLTGEIPIEICNQGDSTPSLSGNQLCPPYPDCLSTNNVGYQNVDDCDYTINCEDGFTEINGFCYYQSDLDVLQIFIDTNLDTGSFSMYWDENSNGIIEPLELEMGPGYWETNWVNGRLINLEFHGPFEGIIPPEIGNLTGLKYLGFISTSFTGEIPIEIGNLINLEELISFGTSFTGSIPHEIGNLINLRELWLFNNQLSGLIPHEIGNLINLNDLRLSNNQLTGSIPSTFGSLENLGILLLDDNQLSGLIPEEICQILPMSFDISNNQFCPPYPWCIEFFGMIGEQDTSECIECPFYLGDINSDLTLDILDIVLVVNCILSESCNWCSDFNEDGITDILDIVGMVNVIMDI